MSPADWTALLLTLRLALISTGVLIMVGTPLAWWLAHSRGRWRPAVEALVALPLVLPPTVLGFYLLLLLGPNGPLGQLALAVTDTHLAFSFSGLVIGSVIYSLPFVVQPLQGAFEEHGEAYREVAATLGSSPWNRFWRVEVPLARRGFVIAGTLGFAHTLGEFGVVLMIGGNIPGQTQVLSILIYQHVESFDYGQAHLLSAVLLGLSFTTLLLVYLRGARPRFRVP